MKVPEVILVARTAELGRLIEQCAKGEIRFDVLCTHVAGLGYKTTSLYELVRVAKAVLKDPD